jgi:hypothetical protein
MKRYWKIAVLANIKDDSHPKPDGVPPDAFADFDHVETIDSRPIKISPTRCEKKTPISALISPKGLVATPEKHRSPPCWKCCKFLTQAHA